MYKSLLWILPLCLLTGCGQWVYKPDVKQGNPYIFKESKTLKIGMSKHTVSHLLGVPHAVPSSTQWLYFNTSEGKTQRLILTFHKDHLSKIKTNT